MGNGKKIDTAHSPTKQKKGCNAVCFFTTILNYCNVFLLGHAQKKASKQLLKKCFKA
jgi:hypothetical protein